MWGVETHLSRNRHLRTTLKSHRTRRTIGVVEDDGNAGFRDACLATLIDEVLLVLRTHLEMHPVNHLYTREGEGGKRVIQ